MGELLHAAGTRGFDFDLANSKAVFTEIDEDDAGPDSPGGKRVPEAVGLVIATGITLHDYKGFFVELTPALFWSARFDVGRDLSLECDGIAEWGRRLSYQRRMARFGRFFFEFA
jgi:hypothetical protein